MNSTTEIVRAGAAMAYTLLIAAFGLSGYFMINSIVSANESLERVGQIIAASGEYQYGIDPDPAPGNSNNPYPTPSVPPAPVQGTCYVGGCSSQVCSDKPDMVSTCEWREAYACYSGATCERQSNGACGWTMDAELIACLDRAQ